MGNANVAKQVESCGNFTGSQWVANGVMIVALVLAQGIGAVQSARAEASGWQETSPSPTARMDTARNRLWVLNGNAVDLYEATTNRLIARFELADRSVVDEPFACPPDLAIAPSGAALVTSNIIPTIWEIDPQRLMVRQHRLSLDADNDKDIGFTGLAFSADGRTLLGVSSFLGSVWTIDLAEDTGHKMPRPEFGPPDC